MIALDIDGTLTADWHTIPDEVVAYLHTLFLKGWVIAIFTGRPYQFAEPIINKFTFPLYVALQNGSIILEMPQKKIRKKHYLPKGDFAKLDQICARVPTHFVIYAGVEYSDECYFCPHLFAKEELAYLQARAAGLKERYVAMDSFHSLAALEFPSYKCFGKKKQMEGLAEEVRSVLGWHAPVIADRFDPECFVVQMTSAGVDKGSALSDCQKIAAVQGPIIAAGDDCNDLEMLLKADIKVVMSSAPAELLAIADIIAPPARELGIIQGLNEALNVT
jgi:5-amino-6-(5-phospho-D-ribitylamino)uracil phosphatase